MGEFIEMASHVLDPFLPEIAPLAGDGLSSMAPEIIPRLAPVAGVYNSIISFRHASKFPTRTNGTLCDQGEAQHVHQLDRHLPNGG